MYEWLGVEMVARDGRVPVRSSSSIPGGRFKKRGAAGIWS